MSGYFVIGTDTGVGKTLVATALVQYLVQQGLSVAVMKPVAAGQIHTTEGWLNEDVIQLRAAANVDAPLEMINPYCFAPAIAPHIAAQDIAAEIELAPIVAAYNQLSMRAQRIVVEGVGGFCVPLNAHQTAADLALALRLPLVLVVGMRLGCLNHALLTLEALQARGLRLAAWVANAMPNAMPRLEENIASLRTRIPAPLLGVVPALGGISENIIGSAQKFWWQEALRFTTL